MMTIEVRGRPLIYLDSAASGQKPQSVIDAELDFYLHYNVFLSRNIRSYWRSAEFRTYVLLIGLATAIIYLIVYGIRLGSLEADIRASLFQVVSVMTSTGFASVDFALWSGGALLIILIMMIIGGSSGSSTGGLKVARFLLSYEFIYSALYKTVHPKAIFYTKMDGRPLGEEALTSLMAVVISYIITAVAAMVALTLLGMEPVIAMSAAVTTLSNAGPGRGALGPMGSFAAVPELGKIVLTLTMWAGRLEFLTVFVVLTPVFWRELLRYRE